jgi:predicted RNA-binding protein with PUA-like domain
VNYWLFKSDPESYGFADLQRDGQTVWDGVNNPMARIHLRTVEPGDLILFYHTGKTKCVLGVMKAVGRAFPDPNGRDAKAVALKVKLVRAFKSPIMLQTIKSDPKLKSMQLLKNTRPSVFPVTPDEWARIEQLAAESK